MDRTPDQIYDEVVSFELGHGEDWSAPRISIRENLALDRAGSPIVGLRGDQPNTKTDPKG